MTAVNTMYLEQISQGDGWVVWYRESWLDAGTYLHRDRLNAWLDQRGIDYRHRQGSLDAKLFEWHFTSHEDAVMFYVAWC
jgi:hypothetical protein